MRSEKELLIILLGNLHNLTTGLCRLSIYLEIQKVITKSERNLLLDFFELNLPPKRKFEGHKFYSYCWQPGDVGPRVKWLKEQIQKLEEEEGSKNENN